MALSDLLTASVLAIDPGVYSSLSADLAAVEAHWLLTERVDAVADLDAFIATAAAATPLEIPDVWTVTGGVDNLAGILRALASTLRFSLLDDAACPAAGDYTDTDADGVPDECDNCIMVANPDQCDGNGDGFGNLCDGDLNDNNVTNFIDLGIFKSLFLTDDPVADLNCNGAVNFVDLGIMKSMYLTAPGPSGLAP
ncbi:MAG: hypothetical protein HKN70_06690, partial [Gammaproteobacteria bacterium]|nr:hypothetical protein [Gammaproteobacteria bacterium]